MIRLLHTNDLHLSARAPASRTDNWADAIFAKLDQIRQLAVSQKVDALLIAGDFFHTKTVPYSIVNRLLSWCWRYRDETEGEILGIAGNHDELQDRADSVATQPLGALFESNLVRDVSVLPWCVKDAVWVFGVPYPAAMGIQSFRSALDRMGAVHRPVAMMGHCFATPEGGMLFQDPIHRYEDLHRLCPEVKLWHFGHDHSDHKVYSVEGTPFINIGALSRGALTRDDLTRTVKVALSAWGDAGVATVTQIRLKVAPSAEVFDLQRKAAADADEARITEFVAQLSADLLQEQGAQDGIEARVRALPIPDAVRELALSYLRGAQ